MTTVPVEQHPSRKRGRRDVDRVVAQQKRADQALARIEQAIDQRRPAISLLLQPVHAGAR
jgi:hypothetical protein